MECNLSGKTCVVTGAGRGIGRAIAFALAADGAHVICVSKSDVNCGSVARELVARGLSASHMAVDVSSPDQVSEATKEILEIYGSVDVLVNNAGITRDGLLLRMSVDDWQNVINTNLNSCYYWTKALLHPMIKKRWGRIVNITSIVGMIGNAGQANYASAKAGIIGFTKSIAREVASRGITVNAVAPGFIITDMTGGLSEEVIESIKKNIPMKAFGTCDDVAGVVKFLCSSHAKYITGEVINVDGGMAM